MRKKILLIAIYLLVASLIFSSGCLDFAKVNKTSSQLLPLTRFSSYEELKNFLKAGMVVYNTSWYYYGGEVALAGNVAENSLRDYSTTNVQVEGVDEADIVKTDGEYIYLVSGKSIVIVKAYPPENATIVAWINLTCVVHGIFVNKDRLVVFEGEYRWKLQKNFVKVYDISNSSNPILARNVSVDGNYFDSRMIGDYVYIVVQQHAYFEDEEVVLPTVSYDNTIKLIPATAIYYCNVSDYYYTFTTIVAINARNDTEAPNYLTALLGSASSLYVSLENIYIVIYKWHYSNSATEKTFIYRINLNNSELALVASGEVPGRVLNQFSMDEYNGYFRIATTTGRVARTWGGANSKNHIHVLDLNLNIVSMLTNLAPGERIYSARFMGNRCYLVTFKKVDPFFVIDLSDPFAPKVLGELKITGYSDYLHPYYENYVIGIGKETIEAEEGDFAWYQGVKISLFDVSDVTNPKELGKYVIGDRGTESPVLRDHKALLVDKTRGLLVMPVLVAELNESRYPNGAPPYAYGDYAWRGAYVFNVSLEEGLAVKGRITHLNNDTSTRSFYNSHYSVKRSLYIDNLLYTISDKKIKLNSLEDLEELNELELPYLENYIYW